MELRVAVRMKGDTRVYEGWLDDDHTTDTQVAFNRREGVYEFAPAVMIESVWFLCRWMGWSEFVEHGDGGGIA